MVHIVELDKEDIRYVIADYFDRDVEDVVINGCADTFSVIIKGLIIYGAEEKILVQE